MDYEKKIDDLLKQMTREEKAGQLNLSGPALVGSFKLTDRQIDELAADGKITQSEAEQMKGQTKTDYHEDEIRKGLIGAVNGPEDAETALHLQKIAVEESRLHIPLLFAEDVIHGYRTIFPIPLAESCAWDRDCWQRTARMAAEEACASSIHMVYSPMVDVSKDARWGRIAESGGEDTLINCEFGAAKVKGYQNGDLSSPDSAASVTKHFAGYGLVEAGKDYSRVDISIPRLKEEILPPFKACIDAGSAVIMPAFNDISGIPCSVNKTLLKDILRDEMGFEGMVVSDAHAIAECVAHGIAEDEKDAAAQALKAGIDLDMSSKAYAANLVSLMEEGVIRESIVDDAVRNVLRLKFRLGLFDDPYRTSSEKEKNVQLSKKNKELAFEAAVKSAVLLKNDGVLPLQKTSKIALLGKLADEKRDMLGTWTFNGSVKDVVTVKEALEEKKYAFQYIPNKEDIDKSDADVFVVLVGEGCDESGEASSRQTLCLTDEDTELLRLCHKTGKPVVTVVFSGRPLELKEAELCSNALFEAWHLGSMAGPALVDLLYGDAVPSGKLTVSFPYSVGQCPIYYDHISTGRPAGKSKYTSRYIDGPAEPLYPFGFGLSYTKWKYENMNVGDNGDSVSVIVNVSNTGEYSGDEIVQMYYHQHTGKRVRPVKKLVDFTKIHLEPNETKTVCFTIPKTAFSYFDIDGNRVKAEGKIDIMTGGNSQNVLTETIII